MVVCCLFVCFFVFLFVCCNFVRFCLTFFSIEALIEPRKMLLRGGGGGGGGGVQGKFFWRIRFKLLAPQVSLIIGETFGEVLGPRRPTATFFELRPAQKLGVK